jgi:hypothetical protein
VNSAAIADFSPQLSSLVDEALDEVIEEVVRDRWTRGFFRFAAQMGFR